MSANTPSRRRRPRDEAARGRLVELQRLEAENVVAALVAAEELVQSRAKRDEMIEAAQARVTAAEQVLARAQGDLVDVSGLQRAALLLGLPAAELPQVATKARVGRPPNPAKSRAKPEGAAPSTA